MCEIKEYTDATGDMTHGVTLHIDIVTFKFKLKVGDVDRGEPLTITTGWLCNGERMSSKVQELCINSEYCRLVGHAVLDYYHHVTAYKYTTKRFRIEENYEKWTSFHNSTNSLITLLSPQLYGQWKEYQLILTDTFKFHLCEIMCSLDQLSKKSIGTINLTARDDWLYLMREVIDKSVQPISSAYTWAIKEIVEYSYPMLLGALESIELNSSLCKIIVSYVVS